MIHPETVYSLLFSKYKKQGWWPIYSTENSCCEYGIKAPRNDADMFEIAIGAILTQNIAWKNVEKALGELKKRKIFTPSKLHKADHESIATSC